MTWRRLAVVLVVLSSMGGLTGCASSEQRQQEDGAANLRAAVQTIRQRMTDELSRSRPADRAAALRAMREQVPPERTATVFATSDAGPVEVEAAVRQQIDGYGPGSITVLMQVCVTFSALTLGSPDVSVADTACSTELPAVDVTIRLVP